MQLKMSSLNSLKGLFTINTKKSIKKYIEGTFCSNLCLQENLWAKFFFGKIYIFLVRKFLINSVLSNIVARKQEDIIFLILNGKGRNEFKISVNISIRIKISILFWLNLEANFPPTYTHNFPYLLCKSKKNWN